MGLVGQIIAGTFNIVLLLLQQFRLLLQFLVGDLELLLAVSQPAIVLLELLIRDRQFLLMGREFLGLALGLLQQFLLALAG